MNFLVAFDPSNMRELLFAKFLKQLLPQVSMQKTAPTFIQKEFWEDIKIAIITFLVN